MTRTRLEGPIAAIDRDEISTGDLIREYKKASNADREQFREAIVERHTGLVYYLAQRYARSSEPFEDLVQVGMLGLLKGLERFDPDRGSEFASFARPTIVGELRRYFRDKTWSVRVPRSIQELMLEIVTVEPELAQDLGRSPTAADLAEQLGVDEEEIHECMEASRSYTARSLDEPLDRERDESGVIGDFLAVEDPEIDLNDYLVSLAPAVKELSDVQKRILYMRFFEGRVQSEIAREMGVSQMQVSRILNRTLSLLRSKID